MYIDKYANGATGRPLEKVIINNSSTVRIGGMVKLVAGGCEPADAVNDRIYGICVGIVTNEGNVQIQNALPAQYDGTWTEATKSYAAASDNLTDKKVKALIEPVIMGDTLLGLLDDTKATTTGSGTVGYFLSVLTTDESKLDESTATATPEQFIIVDGAPKKGGNWVRVKVCELQIAN